MFWSVTPRNTTVHASQAVYRETTVLKLQGCFPQFLFSDSVTCVTSGARGADGFQLIAIAQIVLLNFLLGKVVAKMTAFASGLSKTSALHSRLNAASSQGARLCEEPMLFYYSI